jgi:hypothetical protein
MDPLSQGVQGVQGAEHAITDRRRRPTAHPWADAYLRAHGVADAALRSRMLAEIVARAVARTADPAVTPPSDIVMEEAQRYLDERFASFTGGHTPGYEAAAGRVAFWLADGPERSPAALLDPTNASAALRFQMRTGRLESTPALSRASMTSRAREAAARAIAAPPGRWMRVALCALGLVLLTCRP